MVSELIHALAELGWLHACALRAADHHALLELERNGSNCCLLRAIRKASSARRVELTRFGKRQLVELIAGGWTLRDGWPRPWAATIEEHWLGKRFYFGRQAIFGSGHKLISIVSSKWGRGGSKLPEWPRWLDGALQQANRHDSSVLVVPGTTTSKATAQFCALAKLSTVLARFPMETAAERPNLVAWLRKILQRVDDDARLQFNWHEIDISPNLDATELANDMLATPGRDRVAIGLSDEIFALFARPGGTTESLLKRRLEDRLFPIATVKIASIANDGRTKKSDGGSVAKVTSDSLSTWLDRGAVGWWLPSMGSAKLRNESHSNTLYCKPASLAVTNAVLQICAPMTAVSWNSVEATAYLTHCTRGGSSFREDSMQRFASECWLRGAAGEQTPLQTLSQICRDRRLLGGCRLFRDNKRCVSFSAVPLPTLLDRRCYRSHLGRWDWEPYGLMVRREAAELLGVRPVVYGSEDDYACLSTDQQPYFQPLGKNPNQNWSSECEWRFIGDLDFRQLPGNSILVFVRRRQEALQLSRCSPWPVLWIEPVNSKEIACRPA